MTINIAINYDIQHKDSRHNGSDKPSAFMLSVTIVTVMQSVIIPSVVRLSVLASHSIEVHSAQ